MEKEITSVIKYFSFFTYKPTFQEIYMFLPVKISKNRLKEELECQKYTPPQYSIRRKISKKKLNNWRYRSYIKLLSLLPQIKLVGLSGSISMMNAKKNDDIDLFIITAKNRLFTGRFIALMLAQILGLRRSRDLATQFFHKYKDKVCLNLFFDESNLKVPKFKQTEFVGHEVLQMKPVINKDHIYERFLGENQWVFGLFPNSKSECRLDVIPVQTGIQTYLFITWNLGSRILNIIESCFRKLQLSLINRHRTTEIITDSQLWFHPQDFGKKIKI
jgi:predicted nucleotidyltransferase